MKKNPYLKTVINSQCFGQIAALAFANGVLFNYFDYLECSDSAIILLLTLPNLVGMFLMLPLAYYADTYGKKTLGQFGNALQVIGFFILLSAVWLKEMELLILFSGVIVFALGAALFNSSWFALLDPLMKVEERGHFFAVMRTWWKSAGIIFTFLAQYLLGVEGDKILIQILILIIICAIIRMYFYQQIPELEKPDKDKRKAVNFFSEISQLFKDKKFVRFSAYRFMFPLLTGCVALLFNLYEKNFMGFSPSEIVMMGNLMFIGSLCGFHLGAKLNARYEESQIFLAAASLLTLCGILFPLHAYLPVSGLVYASVITFVYGCVSASFGIAYTSRMLSLLSPDRKSLASAFFLGLSQLGISCSGLFAALIVKRDWNFSLQEAGYNNIYSIILICSIIPLPFVTWILTGKGKKSEI